MSVVDTLKSLMDKIPGYRGYAARESRREADKELRDATAAAFASQVTRITRVQEQLINGGDFDSADLLDSIISRLQFLADRIRTASYGFTGLFDEDKVDETVLDRLYAFDLEIANGVEKIGDLIAQLGLKENIPDMVQALETRLDELHATFSNRGHLIANPRPAPDTSADTTVESREEPITGRLRPAPDTSADTTVESPL